MYVEYLINFENSDFDKYNIRKIQYFPSQKFKKENLKISTFLV